MSPAAFFARPVILSRMLIVASCLRVSARGTRPEYRETPSRTTVAAMTNEEAHRLAREKGVSKPLYAVVRGVLNPLFRVWFRMHVSGLACVPKEGAAIVAPNHKSFWDSFFLGIAIPGR